MTCDFTSFSTVFQSYQALCKRAPITVEKNFFGWTDGWMTCDFTSFSTVFQSYQALCKGAPFTVGQRLTH